MMMPVPLYMALPPYPIGSVAGRPQDPIPQATLHDMRNCWMSEMNKGQSPPILCPAIKLSLY